MAPKSVRLTAVEFQERYGELVAQEYSECQTARTLQVALGKRRPPIVVSEAMLKIWFANQRIPADAVKVSSAEDLQAKCGSLLNGLAAQYPTSFKLCRVLKERTPPVYASDGVLKNWFLGESISSTSFFSSISPARSPERSGRKVVVYISISLYIYIYIYIFI